MITAVLTRDKADNQGTFGRLRVEAEGRAFECHTLELPWRDNRRSLSCIPLGSYPVDWSHSGKFGKCYRLRDVPERSGILIHSGNFAGDKTLGLKTHVEGCILLGMKRGTLSGQAAILQSKDAIRDFVAFMEAKPFRLVVASS